MIVLLSQPDSDIFCLYGTVLQNSCLRLARMVGAGPSDGPMLDARNDKNEERCNDASDDGDIVVEWRLRFRFSRLRCRRVCR